MNKNKYALQLDLFSDYEEIKRKEEIISATLKKERNRQEVLLKLRKKFGKNIVLKGLNYSDGATQKERNQQIGGHKA